MEKTLKQRETIAEATDVESPKDEQTPLQRFVHPSLPLDSIVCGDNCDVLGTFPRECIDLVVTSPPYDDLRTYGGHDWDFYGVAWQLCRVLKTGGVIVWVVADQTKGDGETGSSWAQANHLKALGLRLHDTMVFRKAGVGACGSSGAYWQAWEFMFVLAKGVPKTVNRINDRMNGSAGLKRWYSDKAKAVGSRDQQYGIGKVIDAEGVRDNVWEYQTGWFAGDDKTDHPAVFPERLAGDHIRSWSNEGDIVLDPFNGSGTTTKMARELGRRWIGIDVNADYCEIARKRLEQQLLPFDAVPVSG